MSKDNIERVDIKCDLLKRIIIRIDYQGMINAERWVENLIPLYKEMFQPCIRSRLTTDFMNLTRTREVVNTLGITRDALLNEPLFSFRDGRYGEHKDRFSIDVSCFFTVFYIDCQDYTSIDDYLKFVSKYIKDLCEFDNYVIIKRIGIRKVNGKEFDFCEDFSNIFEKFVMFANPVDYNVLYEGQIYRDMIYKSNIGVSVNYVRQCRELRKNNKKMVQVLLDIDAYMSDSDLLNQNHQMPKDIRIVLDKLNMYIFFLFKQSVNEQYLNSHRTRN